jgi:hypothetical protein
MTSPTISICSVRERAFQKSGDGGLLFIAHHSHIKLKNIKLSPPLKSYHPPLSIQLSGGVMKTMRLITLCLAITSMAGCAKDQNNIYGCCLGQGVVGNKNYVTVSNVWNEMDALPLAEKHCSQYGRSAKFQKMLGPRAVFDCVD